MQYLLDFAHDHTLEDQFYLVVTTATGDLELLWERRNHPTSWQLRPYKSDAPWELVERAQLLAALEARQVDMRRVEQELRAIVMTQIAFADMVLQDAHASLGREMVRTAVLGHQEFLNELQGAVAELVIRPTRPKPRMEVLDGGGAQSESRSGHLRGL